MRESGADVSALLKTHANASFYLDKSRPEFREFGKMQLKALFDAHRGAPAGSNLRILFSNVRDAKEIAAIEELIEETTADYLQEHSNEKVVAAGLAQIPIGYMVEDVATLKRLKSYMAAISKLRRAKPAERFIAVGTNDYQSSLLRDDPDAIEKLTRLDPRMVSGIWAVAKAARQEGIEVTIDGEWGSSPKLLIALLALRAYYRVSATPVVYTSRVPELSELVRSLTAADLRRSPTGRKGEDLRSLLKRLLPGQRPPTLEEFDGALTALADSLEDRVLNRLAAPPGTAP